MLAYSLGAKGATVTRDRGDVETSAGVVTEPGAPRAEHARSRMSGGPAFAVVASNRRGRAVGRNVRQTLELLAVELREATDLAGCASKDAARKILTTGGDRKVEVGCPE